MQLGCGKASPKITDDLAVLHVAAMMSGLRPGWLCSLTMMLRCHDATKACGRETPAATVSPKRSHTWQSKHNTDLSRSSST